VSAHETWLTPGPTAVPAAVLEAQARHPVFHRGPAFQRLLREVTEGLQWLLETDGSVLVLSATGTGALEAALVNCFQRGERILVCVNGYFGDRVARIAAAAGLEVERLEFEWGRAVDPAAVADALDRIPDVAGVALQHSETSTGVVNDLAAVSEVVKSRPSPPLLFVDAVSSAGALPVRTDELGLDLVCGASQKALGATPGVSFVAVSERAWERQERAPCPSFYWDFSAYRAAADPDAPESPWTPAISVIEGLAASLRLLRAHGREELYRLHRVNAAAVKAGVRAIGLEVYGERAEEGVIVTTVRAPEGIDPRAIVRHISDRYGVLLAGGMGPLSSSAFRIGHLGHVAPGDVVWGLTALEATIADLGGPAATGAGAAAAAGAYRRAGGAAAVGGMDHSVSA
jgi:aspartate aminotransferase-like enzyme